MSLHELTNEEKRRIRKDSRPWTHLLDMETVPAQGWAREQFVIALRKYKLGLTKTVEWPPPAAPPAPPLTGQVYLLRGPTGLVKIGYTTNWAARKSQITVNCPPPIKLLGLIDSTDAPTLEKRLHVQFSGKRVQGEWFDLTLADIQLVLPESGTAAPVAKKPRARHSKPRQLDLGF